MKNATPAQTKEFSLRKRSELGLSSDAYVELGRTQLVCSRVGFGAYRVDQTPSYSQALRMALQQGCNLIDTSTNYTDGESEKAIGTTIESLRLSGEFVREEVIVVSKVGYVQGRNLLAARQREIPWADMVEYSEDCWHCIHPDFIREQLKASLARLNLPKIDVYLLHNPEYFFLAHKPKDSSVLDELRHHFYQRMRAAFTTLEECVAEGLIGAYGVSSNTFAMPLDHNESVSLERLWRIAQELGEQRNKDRSSHHFSVVQFPMNLLERDPLLVEQDGKRFIDLVREYNLGALVNRPLNAFYKNRMYRLVDIEMPAAPPLAEHLDALVALEREYDERLVPEFKNPTLKEKGIWPWGEQLQLVKGLGYLPADIDAIEHEVIRPQTRQLIQQIDGLVTEEEMEQWALWRARYWPQLLQTLAVLKLNVQWEQKTVIDTIAEKFSAARKDAWEKTSLASLAIALPASVPGISCVLNGMRQSRYVASSLAVLRRGLVPNAEKVLTTS